MKKLSVLSVLDTPPTSFEKPLPIFLLDQTFQDFDFIAVYIKDLPQTLERIQSDYLTFFNPNDSFSNRRFEMMIAQMNVHQSQLAFSYVSFTNSQGQPLSIQDPFLKKYETELMKEATASPTVGDHLLSYFLPITYGNLILHKNLLRTLKLNLKNFFIHPQSFVLKALLQTEPLCVPEFLYSHQLVTYPVVEMAKTVSYRSYLSEVCQNIPSNRLAPSPWFWPNLFQKNHLKIASQPVDYSKYLHHSLPLTQKEELPLFLPPSTGQAITLITHELSLSGAPKLISDLGLELKKANFQPRLISFKEGPLEKELQERGIPVFIVPQTIMKAIFSPSKLKKILALSALLCWAYPKIKGKVIGNSLMSWPLMLPLVLSMPKRHFHWYIHESFSPLGVFPKMLSDQFFNKMIKDRSLNFWFGSEATKNLWKHYGMDGKVFYWSGLEEERFLQNYRKGPIRQLLAIGTASVRKGTHYLIDAFILGVEKKVLPEELTLTIVGFPIEIKDPFLQDLIQKVIEAKLENRIQMFVTANHSSLTPFYEQADLFIQPSINECLPLTLLQAMSKGIPVLTTKTFGCQEAIEDGISGFVCLSRHSEDLLQKILQAISNPKQTRFIGLQGKKRFEHFFSLQQTAPKIIDFLK